MWNAECGLRSKIQKSEVRRQESEGRRQEAIEMRNEKDRD
jgi:hypothetical protein